MHEHARQVDRVASVDAGGEDHRLTAEVRGAGEHPLRAPVSLGLVLVRRAQRHRRRELGVERRPADVSRAARERRGPRDRARQGGRIPDRDRTRALPEPRERDPAVAPQDALHGKRATRVLGARRQVRTLPRRGVEGRHPPDEWRAALPDQQPDEHEHADGADRHAQLTRPPEPEHEQRGDHRQERHPRRRGKRGAMVGVAEHGIGSRSAQQQLVGVEPITPREHEQQEGAEHDEVALHVHRHVQRAALPAQTRRERVEEDHHRGGEQHGDEDPEMYRGLERQPRDVEAEVHVEVRIPLAELHPLSRQRECAPGFVTHGEEHAQEHREERGAAHQIAARHFLTDLDVADAAREHERHDAVPHRVEIGEEEERREQPRGASHGEPRGCLGAPDVGGAHGRVPLVIDPDRRERAPSQQERRRGEDPGDDPAPRRHVRAPRPDRGATSRTRRE